MIMVTAQDLIDDLKRYRHQLLELGRTHNAEVINRAILRAQRLVKVSRKPSEMRLDRASLPRQAQGQSE